MRLAPGYAAALILCSWIQAHSENGDRATQLLENSENVNSKQNTLESLQQPWSIYWDNAVQNSPRSLPVILEGSATPQSDEMESARLFQTLNAIEIVGEAQNGIWPGFSLKTKPIVLYHTGRLAFLVNHPAPPKNFTQFSSALPNVYIHRGILEDANPNFDDEYEIGGIPTQLVSYTEKTESAWVLGTIVHRLFHYYQDDWDLKSLYFRRDLAENNALARMEQLVLKAALLVDGKARFELIKDFLAIRHYRYGKFGEALHDYEKEEERLEGTAHYAEAKTLGILLKDQSSMPKSFADELEEKHGIQESDRFRLETTGAAQGYFLDIFSDAWKEKVKSGAGFTDVLFDVMPLTDSEMEKRMVSAEERCGYETILQEARKEVEEYQKNIEKALDRFNNSLKVIISCPLSITPDVDINFNIKYRLEDGSDFYPEVLDIRVRNATFNMTLGNKDVILAHRDDKDLFQVALLSFPLVRMNGIPWAVRDGTYEFKTVVISQEGVEIELHGGLLEANLGNKQLKISLNPGG